MSKRVSQCDESLRNVSPRVVRADHAHYGLSSRVDNLELAQLQQMEDMGLAFGPMDKTQPPILGGGPASRLVELPNVSTSTRTA